MSETTSPRAGLTRRSFLKTTGAVAGAAALTGAAAPTLTALAATTDTAPAAEEQVFYSNCGGNCGGPSCRLKGIVREGKLVQVKPVSLHNPNHPEFKTGCVKGQTNPQRLYSTKRNLYPLKRAEGTERGAGEWERITWDEAISLLSSKMKSAQEQYGDSAVAFWHSYVGSGALNHATSYMPIKPRGGTSISLERFIQKTGATVMTPAADLCYMWMNTLMGYSNFSAPASEMLNSKTILLWGINPIGASRDMWHFARKAKENGATLITIDPRFQLSAAQSDIDLPVRPATDGFLALAMCNYIIENGWVDWDFLANESVAPFLRKEDGTFLHLSDLGVEPEEGPINAATGKPGSVDAEVVYDPTTGEFGSANKIKDPAVQGSFEVNGFKVTTVYDYVVDSIKEYTVEKAAEVCDVPADKIEEIARLYATAKPGGIATYQGCGHYHNSRHVYKDFLFLAALTGNLGKKGSYAYIEHLQEHTEVGSPSGGTTSTAELIKVPDAKKGLAVTGQYLAEIMENGGKLGDQDLPLKVVYVMQGNPLACDSGRQALIDAIRKLDFFVVADPYMSDTARFADLVLPIALTWEKEDAAGGYSLFEKAVEPAGECKTDMDVFRMLADKMGFPDLYDKTDEEYLRAALDTPFNKANGFTYDDYKEKGFIAKFPEELAPAGSAASSASKKRAAFYIEKVYAKDENGRDLDIDIERRPYFEEPLESSVNSPEHEKYPLFGFSVHEIYHAQSVLVDVPWMNELRPEPRIEISETAAAERGIKQGDTVRVFNDRGFFVCKAVVTKGIRPDCILLPHGFQTDDFIAGHSTDLTRVDMDPITGNSCYNEILCEVELYDGGAE